MTHVGNAGVLSDQLRVAQFPELVNAVMAPRVHVPPPLLIFTPAPLRPGTHSVECHRTSVAIAAGRRGRMPVPRGSAQTQHAVPNGPSDPLGLNAIWLPTFLPGSFGSPPAWLLGRELSCLACGPDEPRALTKSWADYTP